MLSFNAGEVTPYLRRRIDLEKSASAAERLENFIAMPYGGVIKRPGLRWLADLGTAKRNSRLFPFIASNGSRYLLHFTPDLLTILRTDGTVADTCAFMNGYTWPGTFDWENSIRDLHMEQINDVAFFTHPGTFPLRLSRLSDTEWTLEFIPFDRAPTLDENLDKTQTFTVASNPVAPTWASGASYTAGAKVFTNCEWECIAPHTASAANHPGTGANWRSFWRRMFYNAGDAITLLCDERSEAAWQGYRIAFYAEDTYYADPDTDGVFISNQDHTSDEYTPQTDATIYKDGDVWTVAVPIDWDAFAIYTGEMQLDTVIFEAGKLYVCILGYYPETDGPFQPNVDAGWELYWAEYADLTEMLPLPEWTEGSGPSYGIGDRISHLGRVFVCIDAHTVGADDTSEPGVGDDWEDYWSEVSRMVESFGTGPFSPGNYYRISPERDDQDFQVEIAATSGAGISPVIIVQGAWNFFTYGTWQGTFTLERSANQGATWETVRAWEGKKDRNVADSGIEDDPVWLRLRWQHGAGGSSNPRGVLIPENPSVTGYALMTAYVSAKEMTGTAVTPLMSGNTFRWAEGAFNSRYGYPRAMALHESRLCFAGTTDHPVSLWISASDDLLNFETGPEPDDALFVTLALSASSPIRWMASQRRLFIGTAFGEWVTGSETSDQPLTPTNFLARQYSGYGSAAIAPHMAGDAVLFLERKAVRLREMAFDDTRGAYDAADLTRLSEHLVRGGISCMGWQSTREPGLWVVRRDGVLLHFAWIRREQVAAWSRHSTEGGEFLDVAVIPSDGGDDEIFFVIQRGTQMHLERFPQNWQAAVENNSAWLHLDGVSGSGTSINIPPHLRTDAITRVINATTAPVVTTQNYTGQTTQTIASAPWQIGRPYTAALDSLPIDTQSQDGTTQGPRKRLHKILLDLYQSRGGEAFNRSEADRKPITNTQPGEVLRSGWEEIIPDAGHLDDVQLRIRHADPFPFCLRTAVLRWQLHER